MQLLSTSLSSDRTQNSLQSPSTFEQPPPTLRKYHTTSIRISKLAVLSSNHTKFQTVMNDLISFGLKPLLRFESAERHNLLHRLVLDISHVNAHVTSGALPASLLQEFLKSYGPIILSLVIILIVVSTYAIHFVNSYSMAPTIKRRVLVGTELSAIMIAIVPIFLPFKFLRFVSGLVCFVIFMCLHTRVLSAIPCKSSYMDMLLGVFSFNIKEYLSTKQSKLPSTATLVRWSCIILLIDTCTFLICEVVPLCITGAENQRLAIALITGYWIYLSLEYHYTQTIIFYDFIGAPIPMNLRHASPFLSMSLSEFWGIRWNPVIGKLLQTSFYKPFRKQGISRILCVLSCFAGSGVLHAYPVYISTRNVRSSAMMGCFFVLMGFIVIIEQAFFAIIGWTEKAPIRPLLKNMEEKTQNHFPSNTEEWIHAITYLSDLCVMVSMSGFFYCISESCLSISNAALFSLPLLLSACTVLHVQMNRIMKEENKHVESENDMVNSEVLVNFIQAKTSCNDSTLHPDPSLSCKSTASAMSYTSVTDVGLLSNPTSRNTSFNSSEEFLETSSEKLLTDAAAQLLAVSGDSTDKVELIVTASTNLKMNMLQYMYKVVYILCGWIWTLSVVATLLPLFALPVHEILDTTYPQSIFIGPLVRTIQYAGWI